jgi:ankyrin repeat protein
MMCTIHPRELTDVSYIYELVNLLIQTKANVNATNNQGDTSLHLLLDESAVPERRDNKSMIQLLLQNGAKADEEAAAANW